MTVSWQIFEVSCALAATTHPEYSQHSKLLCVPALNKVCVRLAAPSRGTEATNGMAEAIRKAIARCTPRLQRRSGQVARSCSTSFVTCSCTTTLTK